MSDTKGINRRIVFEVDDSLERRFWEGVQVGEPSECWLWQKSTRNGFGAIKHHGQVLQAQRVSWVIHFGQPDPNHTIGQSCRNPGCCNPKHLIACTPAQSGRRGAQQLNAMIVARVWILTRQGKAKAEIAEQLGIGERNIAWILRGRSWKHLIPDWAKQSKCNE